MAGRALSRLAALSKFVTSSRWAETKKTVCSRISARGLPPVPPSRRENPSQGEAITALWGSGLDGPGATDRAAGEAVFSGDVSDDPYAGYVTKVRDLS
jgi:hypothetical protein